MTIFNAFILGLVQGLSEFLPISSSGHLAILGKVMGIDAEASSLLSFNILLHIATLVAVFIAFKKDIYELICAFFSMIGDVFKGKGLKLSKNPYRKLILMLILGTLPAVVSALLFGDIIENPALWQIGIFLFITAIFLYISQKFSGKTEIENLGARNALCVGIFQAFGVLPGISRSGSTIVGGLFSGLNRNAAVRFSFLLSIPAILGALLLDLKDIFSVGEQIFTIPCVIVGMVTAAVSGYFSIKFLTKLVEKSKLSYFSYYCIFAGIVSIILNFTL